jgi:hypothetical protein
MPEVPTEMRGELGKTEQVAGGEFMPKPRFTGLTRHN